MKHMTAEINAFWISISDPLEQGFPTGGTRIPKGYEIEHQGVRRFFASQSSLYISYRAIYISKFF